METLANCVEMSELEENEARSWLVYHAAPSNHVSEDVLRQYLQRCYFRKDVGYDMFLEVLSLQLEDDADHFRKAYDHGYDICVDGLDVLVLQREDDDADQGRVDSQAQAQESLEHPIFSVGRKSFHKHPIYSILKKAFDALSEEDQMLFMDAALFYPRRSSHDPSWNFNTLDWMHIVHGGSVEDIQKRLKSLEARSVVQSFDEKSREIGIHELWHAFAVLESNQESSPWFYDNYEDKDSHGAGQFRGWGNLQRAFLGRRRNVKEELNFSVCSNLTSLTLAKVPNELDLSPLKCLKYLELHSHGGPRSDRVLGLGSLERLVVLRWFQMVVTSPCLEEIASLRSLQVLQLQFLPWKKTDSNRLNLQHVDFGRLSTLQTFRLSAIGDDPSWPGGLYGNFDRENIRHLRNEVCEVSSYRHDVKDVYMLKNSRNFEKLQSLQELDISGCTGIKALPGLEELVALTKLKADRCYYFEEFPNLQKLQRLQRLDISCCVSLRALPGLDVLENLVELDARGCLKLAEFPNLRKLQKLQKLDISVCSTIKVVPGMDDLVSLLELRVDGCDNLEELPNLQRLQRLQKLDISWCPLIKALPGLDDLVALQELRALECFNLTELPNMGNLTSLRVLNLKIACFYEEYRLKYQDYFPDDSTIFSYFIRPVPIKVVPGLEDLISLSKLTVDFRVFEGVPDLCKLTKLTKVSVRGWSSRAAAGLASLPNLQFLRISYTDGLQLVDPIGISSLSGLRRLKFSSCGFEDVSCLSSLTAFEYLQVKDHGNANDGLLCLKRLLVSVLNNPDVKFTIRVDEGDFGWSSNCDEARRLLHRLEDTSLIGYKYKFDK